MFFNKDKKDKKELLELDKAIDAIIKELNDPNRKLKDDEGHDLDAERIEKLQKLAEIRVQIYGAPEVKKSLDINTVVSVGASVALGVLMLNYEKLGVITSQVKNVVFHLAPKVR